jgi:hypothetical protein
MNNLILNTPGDFQVWPLPEANSHVEQISTNYGKTPAHGPVSNLESPRANTIEEIQESWATAKNHRVISKIER